jgi:ornithine cyclodeaminase/alanine dehydrogenase-like protein (mu-crystallin family)
MMHGSGDAARAACPPREQECGDPTIRFVDAEEVWATVSPMAAVDAIERAFCAQAEGRITPSASLGIEVRRGTFHAKACATRGSEPGLFVCKINANFPTNSVRGLPTIQGVIAVFDTDTGHLQALVDSPSVTALRTAATSALVARRLAREDVVEAAIIGCGALGSAHAAVLPEVLPLSKLRFFDIDATRAESLAMRTKGSGLDCRVATSLEDATCGVSLIVSCTTATAPFLRREHVGPGTLVVAAGADNAAKREMMPGLMACARIVTDLTAQAISIGDLKQDGSLVARVCGELCDVVAGKVPRTAEHDVVLFDSSGLGIEDLAVCSVLLADRIRS